MPDSGYLAVFLFGLLGGVHCVPMCGGIVGALSLQVEPVAASPGRARWRWPLHLAYSVGRIGSYTLAGGIMGALGSFGLLYAGVLPVQITLYVLANLMLVALGLYLTGFTKLLAPFERIGQRLWRRVQPVTRRFLPVRGVAQALPLGVLWGFLPCGMVYTILAMSLVTGSAARGAGLMLAFGIGTLPSLLFAGLAIGCFRKFILQGAVRLVAGVLVLGFGVWGLFNAAILGGELWNGVMCA